MANREVIPINTPSPQEESLSNIDETTHTISQDTEVIVTAMLLGKSVAQKKLADQQRQNQQLLDVLTPQEEVNKQAKKNLSIKDRLLKVYDKYIVKGQFFKKMYNWMKDMVKKLTALAGNWLFKILGFLLLMAVIDPNGTLLQSILRMIVNMVIWFIRVFARMLPSLIVTIINLITEVFPRIIRDLMGALIPALHSAFQNLSRDLEKDFPFLARIFGWLAAAFAPNSPLSKFLTETLPKIFPFLLIGFMIFGVIAKLIPLFMVLKAVILFLGGPITLIIAGIIALGILIYTFWDDIKAFFQNLWGAISGFFVGIWESISGFFVSVWTGISSFFSGISKRFKTFLTIVGAPLIPFILLWKGLFKLFGSFKKFGVLGTFSKIWDFIKIKAKLIWKGISGFFKDLWKWIKSLPKKIWDAITKAGRGAGGILNRVFSFLFSPFIRVITTLRRIFERILPPLWNLVRRIFRPLIDLMSPSFTQIRNVLRDIWDFISNTINRGFQIIVSGINGIRDFFSAIAYDPMGVILGNAEERSGLFLMARAARLTNANIEQVATGHARGVQARNLLNLGSNAVITSDEAQRSVGRRERQITARLNNFEQNSNRQHSPTNSQRQAVGY